MRNVVCQCISNVTMRCDISVIDKQMMNSVIGSLSFILLLLFYFFANPIPYRCNRCLRIHLGNIFSPTYFLTVSDISTSLSPNRLSMVGSGLNLSRTCLQVAVNDGLLKRFGTAEVLGIVLSAMSFKIEVNKDM